MVKTEPGIVSLKLAKNLGLPDLQGVRCKIAAFVMRPLKIETEVADNEKRRYRQPDKDGGFPLARNRERA